MANYPNNLLKKLTVIVFAAYMLSFTLSASAEDYKSMIRYDRVWEHISIHWNNKTAYYVKFDGPEEINGKTYHRLVSFRKARYDYDMDGQCYPFDVDDDYYKVEGYLREENGKVYTLLCNTTDEDNVFWGELYIKGGEDEQPSDLEEKLLYDFTCKEGESYSGLHLSGDAMKMNFKVKSIGSVEIEGEGHRLMHVSPEGHDDIDLRIVEGVGLDSEYGCLTAINFLFIPTCPCTDYIFNRVLSNDGRVIYEAADGVADIPVGDFLYVDNIPQLSKDDIPLYDMMGRRIATSAPGQLYIKAGKKFIGK